MRIRHLKVHCAMGEPAMPTQGVVTKNSFGNRSVDKGITQPTYNKFWVLEFYGLKTSAKGLAWCMTKGQARPKVCQGQDSGKAKGPARHQGYGVT